MKLVVYDMFSVLSFMSYKVGEKSFEGHEHTGYANFLPWKMREKQLFSSASFFFMKLFQIKHTLYLLLYQLCAAGNQCQAFHHRLS